MSGFASAAAVAVALVVGIYWVSVQQTRAQQWIGHTREVLAAIATTRADLIDIQNGQRGFVITGREDELRPYEAARAAVRSDTRQLRELTDDNPLQQGHVNEFDAALQPRLATAAAVIEARRTRGFDAARAMMESDATGRQMTTLRDILQKMATEETRLLSMRLAEHDRRLDAFWIAIAALLAGLLAMLSVLYMQQRRRQEAEHRLLDSQGKFRLMMDSVAEYAILMLDASGRIESWNAGAQRIKGYAADEIVGRHIDVFYTPEDRKAGKADRALATAAAQGRYVEEGWRVRRDGSRFWASVVLAPFGDAQGRLTGYCKITRDLTESRRAQEAQRARDLSAKLIAAQEEERRHVARELHDEMGQDLTLIRMHLAELSQREGPARPAAAECIRIVERAIAHVRGLSLKLRPPVLDDLGLADALEWVAGQQARVAGWRCELDVPELQARLPKEVETTCFRIAQEALTNAARYSGAVEVRIALRLAEGRVQLEVRDNGRGFDLQRYSSHEERKKHFGLVSMSERAAIAGGYLEIETAPGRGTRIHASLPVAPADADCASAR